MKRIICVGNRLIAGDDTGPKVYDELCEMTLPDNVEAIDGGLRGLDLINLVEGAEKVVFVDAIDGFGCTGEVIVLDGSKLAESADDHYGHSAGIGYLVKMLPSVCDGKVPDISLVGFEGIADSLTVKVMAEKSIRIADCGAETSSS